MRVYFICYPHGPADKSGYEHQIVALAEGFKALGVEFYGNVNYWRTSADNEDFLIKTNTRLSLNDFDVIIFSSSLFIYNKVDLLPVDLFNRKRNYKTVFIDQADDLITPGFDERIRKVDIVLKSHFCKKYAYPSNFIPWQFGLTERIISSSKPLPFNDRNNEILTNFRVGHSVRALAQKHVMTIFCKYFEPNNEIDSFEQIDKADLTAILYWEQTGRRHYPEYYKRLGSSKCCSAFGGYLQKSLPESGDLISKILRKIDNKISVFKYNKVYQFDSWRFWESLVSGCCTVHLDFEKYGAVIPVMPVNGEHYIGVDFDNLGKLRRLFKNANVFEDIANSGREWVLQNYAPAKTAERFLQMIET